MKGIHLYLSVCLFVPGLGLGHSLDMLLSRDRQTDTDLHKNQLYQIKLKLNMLSRENNKLIRRKIHQFNELYLSSLVGLHYVIGLQNSISKKAIKF